MLMHSESGLTHACDLWNAVACNTNKRNIILFEIKSIACGPTDLTHAPYVKRKEYSPEKEE